MKKWQSYHLIFFIAILNFIDGISTWISVAHFQIAVEFNPIVRLLIDQGPVAYFLAKVVGNTLLLLLLAHRAKKSRINRQHFKIFFGVTLFYLTIVLLGPLSLLLLLF